MPNTSDAVRNRDARQAAAGIEGGSPNTGDAVRDVVSGTCLTCRINMQHRLLCIEQNPIDLRVIHVPRTNLNRRQVGAESEGRNPDAGDAVTNRDARQAAAATEGRLPDAGDTIGDGDARQVGAAIEGPFPDAGDRFAFDSRRYD